jgi:hypothetical protein
MNSKSFDSKRIAEGYMKRPWLHKSVMDALKTDLNLPKGYQYELPSPTQRRKGFLLCRYAA